MYRKGKITVLTVSDNPVIELESSGGEEITFEKIDEIVERHYGRQASGKPHQWKLEPED